MMRTNLSSILTVAIVAMLVGGQGATAGDIDSIEFPPLNKIEIPKVEKETLSNGIRLYLIEDKSLPIFQAQVRVNCGSFLEPEDKTGLASICGSVMRTGGTRQWTGDELDELLESIGGSVETSIGRLSGSASISVLSDYSNLALEVLAQVLRYPVFDEDKIELAKVQERTSISRRNDEPWPIVTREFRKLVYGDGSPYARHTEYATINAITRDDLVNFHSAYFHPENIQIAIWGDFKKKDIISTVKKYLGDWPAGTVEIPKPPAVDYEFENKVYYIEKKDSPQTNILMGHIGGYTMDEDYPARIVMNSILGDSFGSRLMDNVRSKEGLAYSTGGQYSANIEFPGIFYAYAFTKPQSTVKAIREMVKQIKSMQTDAPTDMEMQKGKDGYLNSFVFNFDTKAEVVGRMMTYDFYGLPEDLLFRRKEAVENVTKEDILATSMKSLHPSELRIVVLGNKDDFDMPLESLGMGPVTEIDIGIPSGEENADIDITPETLAGGKQLILAAVEAHGGIEKYKNIEAVSRTGKYTIISPQGEFSFTVESLDKFPDQSKNVVNMMGRELYDIRNGNTGWRTNQNGELVEKTDEDIDADLREYHRSMMYIFKTADNPAYSAVYDGEGTVGEAEVEFVTVLDEAGEKLCRIGLDKESKMLVYKSYWGETPMGEGSVEETFENITDFGGIKIPAITHKSLNGQEVTRFEITNFKINPEVPAGAFDKP